MCDRFCKAEYYTASERSCEILTGLIDASGISAFRLKIVASVSVQDKTQCNQDRSGIEDKSYTGTPDKVINTRQGCLATTYFVLTLPGSCDSKRNLSLVFISLFVSFNCHKLVSKIEIILQAMITQILKLFLDAMILVDCFDIRQRNKERKILHRFGVYHMHVYQPGN